MYQTIDVEQLIADITPLAWRYSQQLRVGRLDDEIQQITLTQAKLDDDGVYHLLEQQPFHVLSSLPFEKIEQEGYERLRKVAERHQLKLRPAFFIKNKVYAKYVPALEARTADQGMLFTLGSSYALLGFSQRPFVPADAPEGISFLSEQRREGRLLSSPVKVDLPLAFPGELNRFIALLR